MSPERFEQIISAYGADEARWPAQERGDALRYLEEHPAAKQAVLAARELDLMLASYTISAANLEQTILAGLPGSRLRRLLRWLVPGSVGDLWRPLLAGSLPLVLGLAIGIASVAPVASDGATGGDWSWEEQERYLVTPAGLDYE